MRAELLAYAARVLGPCTVVQDCSWGHAQSAVLRLRDADGTSWFLKRHRDVERYRTEADAYRRWVPALGDRAPTLLASHDELQAIIVTAVPGRPAPWPGDSPSAGSPAQQAAQAAMHRAAGATLRRLHDAPPPSRRAPGKPPPYQRAAKAAELERLIPAASGSLSAGDVDLARALVAEARDVQDHAVVPCHRDYTPRNWLVDGATLSVVDFEWARLDAWVNDLARLHLGIWAERPDLRDSFLAGYGRWLSPDELVLLRACSAVAAVWMIGKARETGQASFEHGSRLALRRLATC